MTVSSHSKRQRVEPWEYLSALLNTFIKLLRIKLVSQVTSACSPSDVAARVRTSPTFVACPPLNQVVAFPGF